MSRKSKVERKRMVSKKRPRIKGKKTGPKKDNLPLGYKTHANAQQSLENRFIPIVN